MIELLLQEEDPLWIVTVLRVALSMVAIGASLWMWAKAAEEWMEVLKCLKSAVLTAGSR